MVVCSHMSAMSCDAAVTDYIWSGPEDHADAVASFCLQVALWGLPAHQEQLRLAQLLA